MPTISPADLNILRSQKPNTAQVDLYLAVAPYGAPCFTALVNQPGWVDERGEMVITYDGDVGEANVIAGMTLWIGTSSGANDKGSIRIRSINVGANTITVAENDHIEWSDDDHLCCPGEAGFFELWSKLPRITESGGTVTFYKDYDETYTDPADDVIPPKANAGPPVCAWIDATTGFVDVEFTGDRSFTTEVGAAIATYAWDFADGVHVGGPGVNAAGTCANPNVVRFNTPGFRYVSLTVTDNTAQARTGVVYVPVWIFEEGVEEPYRLFDAASVTIEGSVDEPWTAVVNALQTDTASEDIIYNFPDGALVVIFSVTRYAGAEDAIGGFCFRENIRFVGWLDVETLTFDHASGTVSFDATASDGVMDWLPGFAYTVEDVDNASEWYEVIDLNVDRSLMELFDRHTTVNQVCHVEIPGEGANRPVKIQQYPRTSIYEMAQEHLLKDAKCLLRGDRQGVLRATRDPQFMDAADRAGVTVYCNLLQSDWMNEIDAEQDEQPVLGWIRIGGFAYDQPILSQAPGDCPVQVRETTELEGHIFQDQSEANLWSGLYWTKANEPYPEVPLALCGDWPVFDPADQEYIQLTTTDPLGRIQWSNQTFVVRGVEFRFEHGTCLAELSVEIENDILVGETVEIPDPETPSPSVTPWPGPPTWGGELTHVILRTSQGVFYTESFDDVNPTWLAGNSGLSAAVRQQVVDMSFDFKHGSRLFMVTGLGLGGAYVCQDIWSSDTWALGAGGTLDYMWPVNVLDVVGDGRCNPVPAGCRAAMDGGWYAVHCDPVDGHLEYIAGYEFPCGIAGWAGNGCRLHKRVFWSDDNLGSCTLGDGLWHDPFGNCGPDHCSTPDVGNITRSEGHSLFTYNCAWGAGGDAHRGWSTNGGQTVDTSVGQVAGWIGNPLWHARAGAEAMFMTARAGNLDIWKSGDHGVTWAAVGGGGTLPVIVNELAQCLAMHHLETANLMYVDSNHDLRVSTDGGSTWSAVLTDVASANCVTPAMLTGNPEGEAFVAACFQPATGEWIYASPDLGTTWWNKSGDLEKWLTPGTDSIYQIICVQSEHVS